MLVTAVSYENKSLFLLLKSCSGLETSSPRIIKISGRLFSKR